MIVNCDKCEENFEIILKAEKVTGDVKRVYFICKHCNAKYISYYTSSKIEKQQGKLRKILDIAKKSNDENTYNKLEEKYNSLSLMIKKEMQKLKKKYGES